MYFESHITCEISSLEERKVLEAFGLLTHWKTSCIDRDPILGDRVFFYFTKHSKSGDELIAETQEFAKTIPGRVIREKVEQIIYDTKVKKS